MCTVQLLQNFSACILYLYLLKNMGRGECTDYHCMYSTDITLHPSDPYGLYRASGPVEYIHNSTANMGPTSCTLQQIMYSTANLITQNGPYNLYRS